MCTSREFNLPPPFLKSTKKTEIQYWIEKNNKLGKAKILSKISKLVSGFENEI